MEKMEGQEITLRWESGRIDGIKKAQRLAREWKNAEGEQVCEFRGDRGGETKW